MDVTGVALALGVMLWSIYKIYDTIQPKGNSQVLVLGVYLFRIALLAFALFITIMHIPTLIMLAAGNDVAASGWAAGFFAVTFIFGIVLAMLLLLMAVDIVIPHLRTMIRRLRGR
jgi:hypothetical protein